MIIVSKYFIPKGFIGVTIWPFIFLKSSDCKSDVTLTNHERIHLKQQIELLIVPFFVLYGLEFAFLYFKTRSKQVAYRSISFEKEAYQYENDLGYLKSRPFWNFIKLYN
ncbi:hypothetical protein ACW5R3_11505 [Bizionia sp. KMM 8389]